MSVDERYAEALSSFKTSTVLQDFSLKGKVIVVTGWLQLSYFVFLTIQDD